MKPLYIFFLYIFLVHCSKAPTLDFSPVPWPVNQDGSTFNPNNNTIEPPTFYGKSDSSLIVIGKFSVDEDWMLYKLIIVKLKMKLTKIFIIKNLIYGKKSI